MKFKKKGNPPQFDRKQHLINQNHYLLVNVEWAVY